MPDFLRADYSAEKRLYFVDLSVCRCLFLAPAVTYAASLICFARDTGLKSTPYAEVDDMAMLRLLARDSGALAVVPEVVVQDELQSGKLMKYCILENVVERFYAITARRHFEPVALKTLLKG